jgi:beta-lactam-binding protein with PASTA domain
MEKVRDRKLVVAHPITYQASCEPAGKVIAQRPDDDAQVPAGTPVSLVVASAGAEPVRVPRLVGVRLPDADRASRERPFKIGRVERRPTNQAPPDTILSQSPRADTQIAPGCPIDVVVAVEIQRVPVPDFINMTEIAAKQQLPRFTVGTGLTLGRVSYVQTRGTPGTVIAQDPPAGSMVVVGTPVHLTVVAQRQAPPPPPPEDLVDVPQMKGWTRSSAVAMLQKLGMGVEVRYENVKPSTARATRVTPKNDEVLSQSHSGPVRRRTTIVLTVARVQQPIGGP